MSTSIEPVFVKIEEKKGFLESMKKKIQEEAGGDADLLLKYPVLYMHVWQNKTDKLNDRFSVYVGEANDLLRRTKEHWAMAKIGTASSDEDVWQRHLIEDKDENGNPVIPTLYAFGHEKFQKSLTLDLENRMIEYCISMATAHLQNGRSNPQGDYYGHDILDAIFGKIWKRLKQENSDLFLQESEILKSAIYKASPFHKLTLDQREAKQKIIERVVDAVTNKKRNQLIMVEGEAGTGKTVLTSSTFYELLRNDIQKFSAYMLVNHEEQLKVYKKIAESMGYKEDIVLNPTKFLNTHTTDEPVDVVFIDEAHLLWTQKKQAYNMGDNQLNDIMARAKVTVIMFDECQILRKEQYYEEEFLIEKRKFSKEQNNYIELKNQLRMACSTSTMDWIDALTRDLKVGTLSPDINGYEVKIFDDPQSLHEAIKVKAQNKDTELSRLIASYDWDYVADKTCRDVHPESSTKYWEVRIGDWHLPWNRELFDDLNLNKRDRKKLKEMNWAEQEHTINEVGSTFTIQGFDLCYAGVIIGPSVRFKDGKIWFDESRKAYDKMKGNRTISNGGKVAVSDLLSRNELRVLLTRATKGLYIYACDPDLRAALKAAVQ